MTKPLNFTHRRTIRLTESDDKNLCTEAALDGIEPAVLGRDLVVDGIKRRMKKRVRKERNA